MNSDLLGTNKEVASPATSGIKKIRRLVIGAVAVSVLIVLGILYRSNDQSVSSGIAASTNQKSLLQSAEEAITLNPQDSEAWYTKGVYLQLEARDFQGAIESYSRAIQINPDFVSAFFNRGIAYKTLGRIDEAKVDFETIVKLKDGVAPQSLLNLGLIATAQGETALADEYIQRAYEQDPTLKP